MIRRLFSTRLVRIAMWIFITLATLVVLLFVWTNWSGTRRWAETKAMVEREGETLDFRQLVPQTPPEHENLLAIEPLLGIAEPVDEDDASSVPGKKLKALEALQWTTPNVKRPSAHGAAFGAKAVFSDWLRFVREARLLEVPEESSNPGQDVLNALDAKFPVLKQLTAEVTKRRHALFTPGLNERVLPSAMYSLRLRYYSAAQSLGYNLALRARAAAAAGLGGEAASSLAAMFQLSRACQAEPVLIGFLVGVTIQALAVDTLWEVLEAKLLKDEDLALLHSTLQPRNQDLVLLTAMRGELTFGVNALEGIEAALQHRGGGNQEVLAALQLGGASKSQLVRLIPTGLFRRWKSTFVEVEMRHFIRPLKQGGILAAFHAHEAAERELVKHSNPLLHPDYVIARLALPSLLGISKTALGAQARLAQARAAIALERHFSRHSAYPARLEDLVPALLPAVPVDPCDGKPMRYQQVEGGRYRLWSVAYDAKDDLGKVDGTDRNASKLQKPHYKGDWAWQYEPVK